MCHRKFKAKYINISVFLRNCYYFFKRLHTYIQCENNEKKFIETGDISFNNLSQFLTPNIVLSNLKMVRIDLEKHLLTKRRFS